MRWMGRRPPPGPPEHEAIQLTRRPAPHEGILDLARSNGSGLFVGAAPKNFDTGGGAPLVFTKPGRCLLLCAPSQTGKTTGLAIPQVLAAPGPVVVTSTKLDIFAATALTRALHGRIWVYDPTGKEILPPGARRLRWSPIVGSETWDGALATARAMVKVTSTGEGLKEAAFWSKRAASLLAVLLHRAALERADMGEVITWAEAKDSGGVGQALTQAGAGHRALSAAHAIHTTPPNEAGGYWSTALTALEVYQSDAAVEASRHPNFDVETFVCPPSSALSGLGV